MMRRRQLMGMQKDSRLPPEYQEVEFIKTPGEWRTYNSYKSFICTDISFSSIKKILCRYKVITYEQILGTYMPIIIDSHDEGGTTPNAPYASLGSVSRFDSISPVVSPPFEGVENEYTILNSYAGGYLRIGGWSDFYWTAEGAYYYVYVYGENDVEVAKFIPCYRKSDNKAGLYDLIGNTFYASNGAMDFIAGNPV